MKKIILGLSLLLMLVQNGFAFTDATYDKMIADASDKVWKQIYRCYKASDIRNASHSDINICLKAIDLIKQNPNKVDKDVLAVAIQNTALIYDETGDDLNAYKYYMKAARLGGRAGIQAQKNLNIMCKESPWACK